LWFFINDFYFLEIFLKNFFWGALPGSAGCYKKPTQIPNAGHPIWHWKLKINFFFLNFWTHCAISDTFDLCQKFISQSQYWLHLYIFGTTCITPGIFWKLYYFHFSRCLGYSKMVSAIAWPDRYWWLALYLSNIAKYNTIQYNEQQYENNKKQRDTLKERKSLGHKWHSIAHNQTLEDLKSMILNRDLKSNFAW
jgi:hypothetical protein